MDLHAPLPPFLPPARQELHHRGVPAELAAAALRSVFGEAGMDLAQHLEQLEDGQAERLPLAHAGEPACLHCRGHLLGDRTCCGWFHLRLEDGRRERPTLALADQRDCVLV